MHDHSNHNHNHEAGHIRTAFFLNLGFTLVELAGGFWTNSLSILSDAVHDLGDSLSLAMAWYFENYANRDKDSRFSYGYRRYSLLSALVSTIVLISGSLIVLFQAIPRLLEPEPVHARGMIVLALLGILVNGLAVLRLQRGGTMNARVAAWHLLEDVLGWVAVLIVSVLLLFTNWYFLDPLLSILISGYILYGVFRNLRKTMRLFLQGVPEEVNLEELEARLQSIEHVCSTHHTHIWSMDGMHHVLTTHLVVVDETTRHQIVDIKENVYRLAKGLDIEHTTVEIEYAGEKCGMAD